MKSCVRTSATAVVGAAYGAVAVIVAGVAAAGSGAAHAADGPGMPLVRTSAENLVPRCVTPARMMSYLFARNPTLDPRYGGIAAHYARLGQALGVRWDYAFFQMIVETGNLAYRRGDGRPGTVKYTQNNFAGLGATGNGEPGESFIDIETGVQAHLEHLLMYSGERIAAPVAERTRKVQEWGVLTSWHKSSKEPISFTDVTRRWAADPTYAASVESVGRRFFDGYCAKGEVVATSAVAPVAVQIAVAPQKTQVRVSPTQIESQPALIAEVPAAPALIPTAPVASSAPLIVAVRTQAIKASPMADPTLTDDRVSGVELARAAVERARTEQNDVRSSLGYAPIPEGIAAPVTPQPNPLLGDNAVSRPAPPAPLAKVAPAPVSTPSTPARPAAHMTSAPIHAAETPASGSASASGSGKTPVSHSAHAGQSASAATAIASVIAPAKLVNPADEAIKSLVVGKTFVLDAPMGYTIPIAFRENGTMRGTAGGLASYLGSPTDEGKWWVSRGRLCQRWTVWLDRETQCLQLRQSGQTIHWVRDDGKTGTARIASR